MTVTSSLDSRRRMRKSVLFALCFGAAAVLSPVAPVLAADAGRGAELFQKSKCPMCHGADGSASTPAGKKFGARDLRSAEVQKQTDAELAAVVRNGKGKMPAFGKTIDDAGIADLIAFVRRFAPSK